MYAALATSRHQATSVCSLALLVCESLSCCRRGCCIKLSLLGGEPQLHGQGLLDAPVLELGDLWQRALGSGDPTDRRTLGVVSGDPHPAGHYWDSVLRDKFVAALMIGVSTSELL